MKMLRRMPKMLRFIPGAAQDMRAYFLTLQYWLAGSEENIVNLVRLLVDRYAAGLAPRSTRATLKAALPVHYPEIGVYHPRLPGRICDRPKLPPRQSPANAGTVGPFGHALLHAGREPGALRRRDCGARGAAASGSCPLLRAGSMPVRRSNVFHEGRPQPTVDAVVSLTGFSLVGGPAYNDSKAAEEILPRSMCPISRPIPSSSRRLRNGRPPIAVSCRSRPR